MPELYDQLRKEFYKSVCPASSNAGYHIILVLHVVPDIQEFLVALAAFVSIKLIIAIPYSLDMDTAKSLQTKKYPLIFPTLEELMKAEHIYDLLKPFVDHNQKTIFLDTGGYLAQIFLPLKEWLQENLVGFVEDTEAGHRKYALIENQLTCPVISIARSQLKEAEDGLVGGSCVHVTAALIKRIGALLSGQNILVIGFGKIGKGVCKTARLAYSGNVSVYDHDATKRVLALAEGYSIPEKDSGLKQADIIFGASGDFSIQGKDFDSIKNGAFLVSCTSKRIEFELDYLKKTFRKEKISTNIDKFISDKSYFYLLGNGEPINFSEKSYLSSPFISITHAEILLAIKTLLEASLPSEMNTLSHEKRNFIAQKWISVFLQHSSGTIKNG